MLKAIKGDITKLKVDIIVNAANNSLLGGGGVDGAIHRAAGKGLLQECIKLGGCDTGNAKMTDAYNLDAKKIIHTVGPVFWDYDFEDAAELLESCYVRCLMIAMRYREDSKMGKISIAFPCISTGVYGFPKEAACIVAINAVKEVMFQFKMKDKIDVYFCCFDEENFKYYNENLSLN